MTAFPTFRLLERELLPITTGIVVCAVTAALVITGTLITQVLGDAPTTPPVTLNDVLEFKDTVPFELFAPLQVIEPAPEVTNDNPVGIVKLKVENPTVMEFVFVIV